MSAASAAIVFRPADQTTSERLGVFLRKQTFTNKIVRLAGRVLCTQLASILTYFVLVLVVMSFWDDPSKDMTPIYLLATAGSQISVLCLI